MLTDFASILEQAGADMRASLANATAFVAGGEVEGVFTTLAQRPDVGGYPVTGVQATTFACSRAALADCFPGVAVGSRILIEMASGHQAEYIVLDTLENPALGEVLLTLELAPA